MRKALIVGIDNYPSSPLHGCVNDSCSLSKIIETNGDGSPNFDIKVNNNVKTKSELKGLIISLFSGDNDVSLFYFSGHGFINTVDGYIVTPDYQPNDEGISMHEIIEIANQSRSRNKVIVLDCCHSGAIGSKKINDANCSNIGEGVSILTASRDIEFACEINGHGVFTNLLLEALRGGAADITGHITPGGIYAYVDQALGAWEQRPVFKTNITQFVSLRTITPQVSVKLLRKLSKYFPSSNDEFKLNPSFEDTNSKIVKHEVIQPYANDKNIAIFKELQKFQSVGLIVPVGEDYMYFAAMHSKSCKLTPLGHHYWKLAKEKRLR